MHPVTIHLTKPQQILTNSIIDASDSKVEIIEASMSLYVVFLCIFVILMVTNSVSRSKRRKEQTLKSLTLYKLLVIIIC